MTQPTPYLDELAARLRSDAPDLAVGPGRGGAVCLTWDDPRTGSAVTLVTREGDLRAAVHAIGREARDDLWRGSRTEDAGFNLLLVHLDEVLATRDTARPLRITARGLEWPER